MAEQTVTCPNPECRAALALDRPLPPGSKLRCPRCGTEFKPPAAAADVIPLAPEAPRQCPSCQEPLAPEAVLCVACGFDLRTGRKLERAKKAKRKRAARSGEGPLTEGDLHDLLAEAGKLIRLADRELHRLPYVLGTSGNADMSALRSAGAGVRCANPNCTMGVESRGLLRGGRQRV